MTQALARSRTLPASTSVCTQGRGVGKRGGGEESRGGSKGAGVDDSPHCSPRVWLTINKQCPLRP